jgi:hypothetical protein
MRAILFAALILISAPSATMAPKTTPPPTAAALAPLAPLVASFTYLQGSNWAYSVPFLVKNKEVIEKLISCESHGLNVVRLDPSGGINWGILQFHGMSTWQEMESRLRLRGSPMVPADAIKMADKMISAGFLGRWACAHLWHLIESE